MKRLLSICLLTATLSLPAFGGHTTTGDRYCHCTPGCVEDYDGECSGTNLGLPSNQTPSDGTAELGIALVAILLWLRLKA